MSPNLTILLLRIPKLFLFLGIIFILADFGKYLYYFYIQHGEIIINLFNVKFVEQNHQQILALGQQLGMRAIHAAIFIIAISVIEYIYNRIPLPTALWSYWHNSQQLSPALGRGLVEHFRYNNYLNIKELIIINSNANIEHYNSVRKNLQPLFQAYDRFYAKPVVTKNVNTVISQPVKTQVIDNHGKNVEHTISEKN